MKNILIVDDDEMVRKSLAILISRKGYNVIQWPCSTFIERVIDITKPDCVITDHNFRPGEEEGFDVALRLKAKGIKTILISADGNIGNDAAINGIIFFKKPFLIDPLLEKIAELSNA